MRPGSVSPIPKEGNPMRLKITMACAVFALFGFLAAGGFAQDPSNPPSSDPSLAAKVGRTIKELGRDIKDDVKAVGQKIGDVGQGIKAETHEVSTALAKKFEDMKADVEKMPTHHRVYSRIHWDSELVDAKVEVHMLTRGGVLLRGRVPSEAAKKRAVELAKGSVGVTEVYDELSFPAPPTASAKSGVSK
jgi:osmotically-inducible protein OsmY